jgi:hypothetical protein
LLKYSFRGTHPEGRPIAFVNAALAGGIGLHLIPSLNAATRPEFFN